MAIGVHAHRSGSAHRPCTEAPRRGNPYRTPTAVIVVVALLLGTGSSMAAVAPQAPVVVTSGQARPAGAIGGAFPRGATGSTSGVNAVIIGDSHAWLWAPRVPNIPDLGVPGATTRQIRGQVTAALAMHPRYVVISAGTNDLIQGRSWGSAAHGISMLVTRVRAAGATPVVLLVPQFGTELHTAIWAQLGILPPTPTVMALPGGDQVPALNQAIRSMGVPLLRVPDTSTVDGAHLSAAAYAVLTRQLFAVIG